MSDTTTVLGITPLGTPPWATLDPFLFCVHHHDRYPEGTEAMGPERALLRGRNMGADFGGKDGWSMYHGDVVPGFPRHPHRGFETITIARQGFIDHSDSLGATARFGRGDVQWMTAGKGVVHSEMFPLVNRDAGNPTELFQIWLNLPRADKMADPHFTMFWGEQVPRLTVLDDAGEPAGEVTVIAGALGDLAPLDPPPHSWAARPQSDVAVWTIQLDPGASWTAPPASAEALRVFYFFSGDTLTVSGQSVTSGHAIQVTADAPTTLHATGDKPVELLMLQGRPLNEPVVQHGPFVMNSPGEVRQAMMDFQRTGFGGWPWRADGPVHDRDKGRFAVHVDGREERP